MFLVFLCSSVLLSQGFSLNWKHTVLSVLAGQ